MPTTTTRRNSAKTATKPPLTGWFKQWLGARDQAAALSERQTELRDRIKRAIPDYADEVDDNGSQWYNLQSRVSFTDRKGKVFQYAALKLQRSLTPANPVPDPELAEELLARKGLWLDEKQQKAIQAVQLACPYVTVEVTVDADAVAAAYFKGILSEEEYEGILVEQRETFSLIPVES
jgi:hypothetical protein